MRRFFSYVPLTLQILRNEGSSDPFVHMPELRADKKAELETELKELRDSQGVDISKQLGPAQMCRMYGEHERAVDLTDYPEYTAVNLPDFVPKTGFELKNLLPTTIFEKPQDDLVFDTVHCEPPLIYALCTQEALRLNLFWCAASSAKMPAELLVEATLLVLFSHHLRPCYHYQRK